MLELASGVINVLEKKLLSRQDQERMLKAPNRQATFDVLFDTDLSDFASKTQDVEDILKSDLEKTKDILSRVLSEKEVFLDFLFLRFDVFNIKLCLKNIVKQSKSNEEPISSSLEDYNNLCLSLQKNKPQEIKNKTVRKLAELVLGQMPPITLRENISSSDIETLLDQTYFAVRSNLAKEIKDKFVSDWMKLEIDVANLKKALKKRNHIFIPNGNLKEEEIKKLGSLQEGEIIQDLNRFLEVYGLSLILERTQNDMQYLESGLLGFLSKQIFQKERDSGCGYEKALSFWQKKLNSHYNIRLMMFSKENNIEFEKITPYLLPL